MKKIINVKNTNDAKRILREHNEDLRFMHEALHFVGPNQEDLGIAVFSGRSMKLVFLDELMLQDEPEKSKRRYNTNNRRK